VLAELRRNRPHPDLLADPDRGADVPDLAQFRVRRVLDRSAVGDLRVGEHLRVVVDRAARYARSFQHLDPCWVVFVVSAA